MNTSSLRYVIVTVIAALLIVILVVAWSQGESNPGDDYDPFYTPNQITSIIEGD